MIYDCFCFFNELDILELRLNILNDIVDKFVLVEATYTHSGHPKKLFFQENKTRFNHFQDKIIHIIVEQKPDIPPDESIRDQAWALENAQRNAIIRGLSNALPDDTIIVSDVDEIPNPSAIKKAIKEKGITRLGLRMYYFYLNYRNLSLGSKWLGPQVASYSTFCNPKKCVADMGEFLRPYVNKGPTASVFRFAAHNQLIKDAGWHFSYLGGIPAVQKKITALAHTEFNKDEILDPKHLQKCISQGVDIFGRGDRYYVEKIDHTYPEYIRKNVAQLSPLIFTDPAATIINKKVSRFTTTIKLGIQNIILKTLPPVLVSKIVKVKKKFFPGRFV